MHVDIYVEELSAKKALDQLVPRIVGEQHSFQVLNFRNKKELLKEIPKRLKGYARWIPEDWRIAVLVDEDRQDCHVLKAQLVGASRQAGLHDRVLNRVVVEELEAWFFGDIKALRAVYPKIPESLTKRKRFRDPDAISGGTWEALDQVLRRSGYQGGLIKAATAEAVASHMDPWSNTSRSFQVFRDGLRRLMEPVGPKKA